MIEIEEKKIAGRNVKLITIGNETGLVLTLCNIGASVYEVKYHEEVMNYVLPLHEFMRSGSYAGKSVGRTAGRVKNGKVMISGKEYHLATCGQKHCLHGGNGLEFRSWIPEVEEDDDEIRVFFYYQDKDGDQGYPGNLITKVAYILDKHSNEYQVEYKAKSDADTLVNLTNHVYWNLNGKDSSIASHRLWINAGEYAAVNNELIFEEIRKNDEIFDFSEEHCIGDYLFADSLLANAKGYDHDYLLNEDGMAAKLVSGDGKITLEMETSNPVCHIYTGNYLEKEYGAVALEMEKKIFLPDTCVLKKNEIYQEVTLYRFLGKR